MEKPKIFIKFAKQSEYCEKSSSKPVSSFIPKQAMTLAEMVARFDRGQRLNIKQNFAPEQQFTQNSIYEEDFDDAPPDDIHDIVDVQNAYETHKQKVSEFKEKRKKKPAPKQKKEETPVEPTPASVISHEETAED